MAEEVVFELSSKRLFFVFVLQVFVAWETSGGVTVPVHYMWPGMAVEEAEAPNHSSALKIYCYAGGADNTFNMFSTVLFQFSMKSVSDGYDYYRGSTSEEVVEKHEEEASSWSPSKKFFRSTSGAETIVLDTFRQECVGIKTSGGYTVAVNMISVDFYKVGLMFTGLLLFFLAPRLARNELFFYVCGIVLGILFSILFVIYFFSKFIPKKTFMVGVMVSSWSASFFVMKYILQNLQHILKVYFPYVLSYVIATGFISFAVCYRMGLPTDRRSKNLIQWAMQVCSLGLIWLSNRHTEMNSAIIFVALLLYKFSSVVGNKVKTYWMHKFPPKYQFLSEEEFIEQGAKETQTALENLRTYCRSPDCNQWKTVLNVKNPRRFAEFMTGASHVTNEELLAYEHHSRSVDLDDDIYTDDSSDSEEDARYPNGSLDFQGGKEKCDRTVTS